MRWRHGLGRALGVIAGRKTKKKEKREKREKKKKNREKKEL